MHLKSEDKPVLSPGGAACGVGGCKRQGVQGCGSSCPRGAAGAAQSIPPSCAAQDHLGFERQTGRWGGLSQTGAILSFRCGAGHVGWRAGVSVAAEGLFLLAAPTRLSWFCSGTGMLQICGDFVLPPPDAAWCCAAGGHAVAAPGEGTLGIPPRHPAQAAGSRAWFGAQGLEGLCRRQAGGRPAGKQKPVWFGLGRK